MKNSRAILIGIAFLFIASCASQSLQSVQLPVGNTVFQTELAQTPQQRETGLMNRPSMPEDHAMLFVFEDESPRVFWMKNTLIPLSIAYINKNGIVKEIHDMEPLSLAPVSSQHSVKFALEVNQGVFQKKGIQVGDSVDLSKLPNQ